MDQEAVGNIVLLAIVTLISVVQNGFFAHKVEHESKTQNGRSFQRTGTLAFERVYTANQNCVDAYPTFLVVLWSAGLLCSQVPAAFAGLMYLFVRQKYFVGYLGERTQRVWALNDFLCLASQGLWGVKHFIVCLKKRELKLVPCETFS
ncbi:arachidonate 5-lipoxygenase-activating protein isoform X2 [Lontra canadensis]|uniref:arachidonate 5-lipoxygenase-activating protein isoform X2 n=1 Tax=Lontra canadensis TaxID=76717 RepID=UPI0013F2ECAD|nr:arachidonate 5-lipoxygenase-activating protein isoform X2 [Lontra canadensis]